jgi:hypothetical protein
MTWGAPLLAGIVAAIAIPSLLILYFLKLRRREVEISSTLLWKKAIEDLQANAPFQRLRRNILLLLQLLVLAAAIFAIAQPQMMGPSADGTKHVILIDRSASMRATDGLDGRDEPGVARLEQAKREALALVESLSAPSIMPWKEQKADEAMVVAFGASGEALQPFTSDKARLRAAIEGIGPTDAPSSITEAMSLVRAQAPSRSFTDETTGRIVDLPPGPVGTIHLFTDGRIAGAQDADLHAEDVLRYYRVGAPDDPNIGVTSLRAGRGLKDPDHLSIFVGLQSTAAEPREVDVELLINGASTAVRSASVSAAEVQEGVAAGGAPTQRFTPGTGGVTFEMQRPEGAFVTVALRRSEGGGGPLDHLAVDDVAWIVAPPSKRLAIALVMPPAGNLFLREAVAGLPIESVRILTPEEYARMAARGEVGRFDAVIFDRWLPDAPDGLPPGRFLIFGVTPPLGLVDRGEAEATVIYDWVQDHPALRSLNLGPLQIFETRRVEAVSGGAARALANGGSGVLMAEIATAQTRALVVTFDIAASSWAMESSFIVFLGQALRYLAADLDADIGRMARPGETFSDRIPEGAQSVRVTHLPTGVSETLVPAPDGKVAYGPIVRVGEYELSWLGEAGPSDERDGSRIRRRFTVNLLNPDESDTRAAPDVQIATRAVGVASDEDRARQPRRLWPWLLLAALAIMMIEWWIYNRKVTL